MRLKRLNLFGFKSFPNRTRIDFSSGVCAIVGPNGCGKSNVVDAIRWVLGEQSAKMLRARSMDDVIFSGSNGRSVNFAEVSLVLENKAGMAPPEFENLPEIEIKRMVSRKGDTRYLINGKNCRLKDIHYLLMDTGAGTRAYSIVDQGQVGQFVEMSPQERRHIIEEVAGISRYKARRIEAERRMADTSRNLERLNDLITEVDRQLRSASRQAKKTQRYLALRKEEESFDKALLKYAWDEQVELVKQLEADMETARGRLEAANARLATLRAEKEAVNAGLLEKEDALKKIKSGLSGAEKLLENLRRERAEAEKRHYQTTLRLQSVEKNSRESEKRVRGTERRYREVLEILEKLHKEQERLTEEERIAAGYVEDARLHVEQVRSELEEVKVQLVDAAAEQARLDSERRNLRERAARLEKRIQKGESEQQAISDKLDAMNREHGSMAAEAEGLEQKLSALKQKMADAERELKETTQEFLKEQEKARDTEARLVGINTRLDALKAVDAAGEGIPPEVRALLEDEKGVLGMLADFIDVERGWEQVFETAFGPRLHALVVDSREACERIAASFRKDASGTLYMLVLPENDSQERTSPSEETFVPLAGEDEGLADDGLAAHIRADVHVVPVLKKFLSGVFRVESIQEGLNRIETGAIDQSGTGARVMVTANGATVTEWMEISIQGKGAESSGLLVRKAMIRELQEESAEVSSRLEAIRMRRDSLRQAEAEKKKIAADLRKEVDFTKAALSKLQRNIESLRLKIESAASRLEVMEFELSEARDELIGVELDLQERETALEQCSIRHDELSASLKGREGALSQQEGVLERRKQKQQELRIELARIESNIREREKEKKNLERRKERMVRDSVDFATEKKRLSILLSEQEGQVASVTARVEAQEAAVSDARRRVQELEKARDAVLQELSACDARITSQEKIVREAEKQVHTLDVEFSKSRQALEYIGQSALERHQVSAAAIQGVEDILEQMDVDNIKERLEKVRARINKIGAVNLGALDEYNELKGRWEFLEEQKQDLEKSMADLRRAIDKINRTCRSRFREALEAVNNSLNQVFPLLFDGGSASLQIDSGTDVLEAGVDYMVNLPGKRIQHLNLLSGGEKTMAAMALLFAVYFIKPSPFCLLDEVDAPLDEANTDRFNKLIKKIAKESQVVIITHNQRVMDTADVLYGVTMEDRGVSKVVSVNLVTDVSGGAV